MSFYRGPFCGLYLDSQYMFHIPFLELFPSTPGSPLTIRLHLGTTTTTKVQQGPGT